MLSIQGIPVKLCLEQIAPRILRLSILPKEERVQDVFATMDLSDRRTWGEPALAALEDGAYTAGDFSVTLQGSSLSIACEGKAVQTLTINSEGKGISFPLGKSRIFGLGHGYKQHPDRRGASYDLRVNGQVPGIIGQHSATSPTGYVIGSEGWALFFHQPWKGTIDLTGDQGVFSVPALHPAAYADIFVVAFDRMEEAACAYYQLTGLPPMPPRYAFGYQQSYRTLAYNGVNEVMRTAEYMRAHDLPCDMLIYLGTGYCDNGWNSMNGNFDFHPVAFPTPKETLAQLHGMGYKINLHVTRCYTGLHGAIDDENVSPLEYDHAKNYWRVHEKLYDVARNECWWPDDADEVDITARLTRHRMYYEGSLKLNPDVRPFQMQRNAFPGHTKWGGIIWSGDVMSQWETLKNQVPIGLNASLSCSPYWGTDTGGFFSTKEFTGEMFIRWFEYSAFTPFLRGHGRPSYLHSPMGWSLHRRWEDVPLEDAPGLKNAAPPPQDALPDDRVEPICRKYLHLRYRLLPYLYTLARQVYDCGMPMMRPMWFDYPQDEACAALGSQYLLGPSLLVCPVTAQGTESWQVYLPQGLWYNFWTNEALAGGRWVEVPAPLDTIPLFVKAGAILPLGEVRQCIPDTPPESFEALTLRVYPGQSGSWELYEDDGISLGYQRNECSRTLLTWDEDTQSLQCQGASTLFPGTQRTVEVEYADGRAPQAMTIRY